jgi:hypothetical protein
MTESRAADAPVQSPLTLVMTVKPEDREILRTKVHELQARPPENNPIIAALDKIGTVHFARFVIIDEDRLAVITTYDGDFERYIMDFVDYIGPVFDDLLPHMVDAPELPVEQHRQGFLDYVRRRDLTCVPPFYSAYSTRTVQDILADSAAGPQP